MTVVDTLKKIFNLVLPIALLIMVFMEIPRRSITDNDGVEIDDHKKPKHEIVINTIMLFLVGGIFIGLIVLVVTKYRTLLWIITLFAIPGYLQNFTNAYISVGIIRTIVNTNSCEKLSQKERAAINSFAYIIWFLGLFKFYDFIFEKINNCTNDIIADFLLLIVCVALSFIYIFLICALSIIVFMACIKIVKKICSLIPKKEKVKKVVGYFINKRGMHINHKLIVLKNIDFIMKHKMIYRIFGIIIFPLIFVLDVLLILVKTLIAIILSCIGDGCNLLRLIKNSIIKLQNKLLIISDKQMIAIAFRIAMIASLTSVVAENRFCGLVRNQDSTTAVFEFVASAIIIPIIFEWVYSYKQSQNNP